MNTTLRLTTLVAAVTLGLVAWQPASAAPLYRDIHDLDRLAVRLTAESETLYRELRAHSFRNPGLRVAMSEVAQLTRQADHIHEAIHAGRTVRHLHRDVEALQELVHHIDEHLAPYSHFRGHLVRIDRLAHSIDDCLHQLAAVSVPSPPTRYPANVIARPGFQIRIGR